MFTAIKTGRYTHEKKTRDIEEVKRLQRREAVQNTKRGIQSPEDREAELEKIIKHITAAHLQQTPHSPDFFQKLPQREAEYLVGVVWGMLIGGGGLSFPFKDKVRHKGAPVEPTYQ